MPLMGTSHCVSENWSLAGLVQICSWSNMNSLPSAFKPRGGIRAVSSAGSFAVFCFEVLSFSSVSPPLCFVLPSDFSSDWVWADLQTDAVSVRLVAAKLSISRMALSSVTNIPLYGWMYATAKARDEASCADCMMSGQLRPPILGAFSGTTIMSPARNVALIGSPLHQPSPLFFAAITEPSARITKTAFLSAICVIPPAWLRYHLALRPG